MMNRLELLPEDQDGMQWAPPIHAGRFARLDMLDELFNSLHGVGDVDCELKELVLLTVADIHDGGQYLSTVKEVEKKEMVVEIAHIIAAALRNRPAVAKAVLQRWMNELEESAKSVKSVAEIISHE